jgi:hypothetical protein
LDSDEAAITLARYVRPEDRSGWEKSDQEVVSLINFEGYEGLRFRSRRLTLGGEGIAGGRSNGREHPQI